MAGHLILAVAALTASHALLFAAGGWYLRWRGLRHQMRAAQTAISNQAYLAQVLAGYRQQIRRIVRLPRLHLPRFHFHARRSA